MIKILQIGLCLYSENRKVGITSHRSVGANLASNNQKKIR